MGISFEEAMSLIETGFLAGADANGDFLDKVKQYPVQFKNAGFSAEEFIKISAQEVKSGIYGDKLLDSIKESDLAIKEFTNTQRDALKVLGEDFAVKLEKDVSTGVISTKEALVQIAEQANARGIDLKEFQTITADVFKGAGEDAGGAQKVFEEVFTAISSDISDYIDETNELVINQRAYLQSQEELQTALQVFGSAGEDDRSNTNIEVSYLICREVLSSIVVQGITIICGKTNRAKGS